MSVTDTAAAALPNLVLEGFMGTGKSTVGAILARRLEWDFIDTDEQIEQKSGMPIREIFSRHGEQGFRALERAACLEAASRRFAVVALGGGAMLDPDSRLALEESGIVILLTCELQELLGRLEESARKGERPMLAGNFAARVEELLYIRGELYGSIPLKVDTTNLTPEEVADRVMDLYGPAAQDRVPACII